MKTQTKHEDEAEIKASNIDPSAIQGLEFAVRNMKTEIDYQKKIFSVQKL